MPRKVAEKAATLSEQAKTRRQALVDRIDTQNITSEDLVVYGDFTNTLLIKIPAYFPQLQNVVLKNIRTLNSKMFVYAEYVRNAINNKTEDGEDHPSKSYFQALLSKEIKSII